MSRLNGPTEVVRRVEEIRDAYASHLACAANLFCDRHSPQSIAYTVVSADGSSADLTYGELREESEYLATGLRRLGVRPGDRIATLMGKTRRYLVTLLAIWRVGAVHVPLFTAFAPSAVALRLRASNAKFVVCDASQRSKVAASENDSLRPSWGTIVDGLGGPGDHAFDDLMRYREAAASVIQGADATIIQIYTSGTTGSPKGVEVPLRAVTAFHTYAEFGLDLQKDDIFWNVGDPGWAYGLYFGVLAALSTGIHSIFFNGRFTPEAMLVVLDSQKVTNLTAAPTAYRALRNSNLRPALLHLRCASSAGEPLTPEVNDWALETLGVRVHDHYGQTEAGMLINNHHHALLIKQPRAGSMGQAMPGWKAVVLKLDSDELAPPGEVGRVAMELAESPLAWFKGYVGDPSRSTERFTPNGRWYLTGDIGRVDEEGFFYFSARDDDVIIMAGYRIGPFEVESVLVQHPAVAECAVVATADEVRGEVLEAVVVLAENYTPSDDLTAQLQSLVKTQYAAHAYPRRIHYWQSLPKTPSGKLQRFIVRERLRENSPS